MGKLVSRLSLLVLFAAFLNTAYSQAVSPGQTLIDTITDQLPAKPVTCARTFSEIYSVCAVSGFPSFEIFKSAWEALVDRLAGDSLQARTDWIESTGSSEARVVRKQYILYGNLMTVFYDDGLPFDVHILWDLPPEYVEEEPATPPASTAQFPSFLEVSDHLIEVLEGTSLTCPSYVAVTDVPQRCAETPVTLDDLEKTLPYATGVISGQWVLPNRPWRRQTVQGVETAYTQILVEPYFLHLFVLDDGERLLIFTADLLE